MALSSPITFAGVQSVDFVSRSTGLPLGRLRVLQSVEFSEEIEKTNLFGGAQKSSWNSIDGQATRSLSVTSNEYPEWLLELVGAGTKTSRSAETAGGLGTTTNKIGTTVAAGVTVSKTASDEADLKFGRYFMVATAAKTFDVYVAYANLNSTDFTNDTLKLFSVDLAASPVVNATYGLTFTDNSSNFTVGNVAYFDVRAINTDSYTVKFGAETATLNDVEIFVAGQLSSGKQAVLHVYRAKGGGMPITFAPNTFSEYTLEFDVLYCASEGGTHEVEYIDLGTSGTC